MNGNKMKQITFSVVTMLILTACGGGGDSSSPNIKDNNEINSNNRDSSEIDSNNNNEENERIKNLVADVKKTGQTTIYSDYDDGYYNKGVEPNYTRENDIVTDHITNLMWQDDNNAKITIKKWITDRNYNFGKYNDTSGDTATTYCKNLSLGGYSDWRLPTIVELNTIVVSNRMDPSIDNTVFDYPTPNGNYLSDSGQYYITVYDYWSSSSYRSHNIDRYAYIIDFSEGFVTYKQKNIDAFVRCVRTIQQ